MTPENQYQHVPHSQILGKVQRPSAIWEKHLNMKDRLKIQKEGRERGETWKKQTEEISKQLQYPIEKWENTAIVKEEWDTRKKGHNQRTKVLEIKNKKWKSKQKNWVTTLKKYCIKQIKEQDR